MRAFKGVATGFWVLLLAWLLAGSPTVAAGSDASAVVKSASERMLAALEGQRSAIDRDPSKIYGLVDQILVPHFDFSMITKAAVGRHWSEASAAQQQALTESFQQVLIRTYAKALLNYSGQEIRFLPEKPGPRSTVVVPTEVREPGGKPVPIDYRLHRHGGGWKVYDVKIDNVSLVSNYRGSFGAQIRQKGIDGLISRLNEMNAQGRG